MYKKQNFLRKQERPKGPLLENTRSKTQSIVFPPQPLHEKKPPKVFMCFTCKSGARPGSLLFMQIWLLHDQQSHEQDSIDDKKKLKNMLPQCRNRWTQTTGMIKVDRGAADPARPRHHNSGHGPCQRRRHRRAAALASAGPPRWPCWPPP